jgi:hypothetical protein
MTKIEFFTKHDFNNLPLKDKITKIDELLNGNYNSIPGKDDSDLMFKCDKHGNASESGEYRKANDELQQADKMFIEMFPKFTEIAILLKHNQWDMNKTYSEILRNKREEILNNFLNDTI